MSRYRYRSYDTKGVLNEGAIEARSRETALTMLHHQGQFPLELTEAAAAPKASAQWWDREISFGDGSLPLSGLMLFTRELATLVKADLPLDESLRIVSLQPMIPRQIRTATLGILEAVREGQSLSNGK